MGKEPGGQLRSVRVVTHSECIGGAVNRKCAACYLYSSFSFLTTMKIVMRILKIRHCVHVHTVINPQIISATDSVAGRSVLLLPFQIIVELVTEGMDAAPVSVSVEWVCGSVWNVNKRQMTLQHVCLGFWLHYCCDIKITLHPRVKLCIAIELLILIFHWMKCAHLYSFSYCLHWTSHNLMQYICINWGMDDKTTKSWTPWRFDLLHKF